MSEKAILLVVIIKVHSLVEFNERTVVRSIRRCSLVSQREESLYNKVA